MIHGRCLDSLIGIVLLPLNKVYYTLCPKPSSVRSSKKTFGAYFFANIADKLKNQSDNRRENELAGLFTAKVRDAYRSYDELYDGSIGLIGTTKIMQINKSNPYSSTTMVKLWSIIHHGANRSVNLSKP